MHTLFHRPMKRFIAIIFLCAMLCMSACRYTSDEPIAEVASKSNTHEQGEIALFAFYSDPEVAAFANNFYADPPSSLTFDFQWFSHTEHTVTDMETITATFEALRSLVVGAQTDMMGDDYDTHLIFNYDDGRTFPFWFNIDHLCIQTNADSRVHSYEVSGFYVLEEIIHDVYAISADNI